MGKRSSRRIRIAWYNKEKEIKLKNKTFVFPATYLP